MREGRTSSQGGKPYDAYYVFKENPDLGQISLSNQFDYLHVNALGDPPSALDSRALLEDGKSILLVMSDNSPAYLILKPAHVRPTRADSILNKGVVDFASTETVIIANENSQSRIVTIEEAPAVQALLE